MPGRNGRFPLHLAAEGWADRAAPRDYDPQPAGGQAVDVLMTLLRAHPEAAGVKVGRNRSTPLDLMTGRQASELIARLRGPRWVMHGHLEICSSFAKVF